MKLLGNILWLVLGGLADALSWLLLGLILCITIIGIPFGKQCFKFAELTLSPFGKDVDTRFSAHPLANLLWLILVGWIMAITNFVTGILLCITIIGIPFGLQWFKLAQLSLFPFGAKIK
jgi:uncharacterized membrane protein YccF (DUF307 family)